MASCSFTNNPRINESASLSMSPSAGDARKTLFPSTSYMTSRRHDTAFALACIILHESLHCAAFYILVPGIFYIREGGPLEYSDNLAVEIILIFTGVAFFLPLLGGVVGDTMLGRYNAILLGTVIEFVGMVVLLIYAVLVYAGNAKVGPELSVPVTEFLFVTALVLIALGMGFIKANVTPFGARQLQDSSNSTYKIQSYFRWYIFSVSLGKFLAFCPIAMFLMNYTPVDTVPASYVNSTPSVNVYTLSVNTTPIVNTTVVPDVVTRAGDLKAVGATVLQVAFVGAAIFIFMVGKTKYKMIEPKGNTHLKYIFSLRKAPVPTRYSPDYQEYLVKRHKYKMIVLKVTVQKAALFAMYIVFEAMVFQLISTFMLQFKELSQPAGLTVHLPLTFMNTISTAVIILAVPFLECFIRPRERAADEVTEKEINDVISQWTNAEAEYKTSRRTMFGRRPKRFLTLQSSAEHINLEELKKTIAEDISAIKRRRRILIQMGIGLGLAALVALCAGTLEKVRKQYVHLGHDDQPSVFWQTPQYLLMGVGDLFGEISAYEFAHTESLPGINGFTTGMFISSYGLGSFVALACYAGTAGSIVDPTDFNTMKMENVYFGQFGFVLFLLIMFTLLARQYHIETPCRLQEPDCPYSSFAADDDPDDVRF